MSEAAAYAASAAAHEWDEAVPRWNLSRERFIAWHVRMAEKSERRRLRREARNAG
jgi:hypothetical protein